MKRLLSLVILLNFCLADFIYLFFKPMPFYHKNFKRSQVLLWTLKDTGVEETGAGGTTYRVFLTGNSKHYHLEMGDTPFFEKGNGLAVEFEGKGECGAPPFTKIKVNGIEYDLTTTANKACADQFGGIDYDEYDLEDYRLIKKVVDYSYDASGRIMKYFKPKQREFLVSTNSYQLLNSGVKQPVTLVLEKPSQELLSSYKAPSRTQYSYVIPTQPNFIALVKIGTNKMINERFLQLEEDQKYNFRIAVNLNTIPYVYKYLDNQDIENFQETLIENAPCLIKENYHFFSVDTILPSIERTIIVEVVLTCSDMLI